MQPSLRSEALFSSIADSKFRITKCTTCLPNKCLVCLANILTCQTSVFFLKEKNINLYCSPYFLPDLPCFLLKYFYFPFCCFFLQFTWLPNEIGVYDLIVMLSLQRLSNPKGKRFWIIILFWETVHLPLPQANTNTYFSLRGRGHSFQNFGELSCVLSPKPT